MLYTQGAFTAYRTPHLFSPITQLAMGPKKTAQANMPKNSGRNARTLSGKPTPYLVIGNRSARGPRAANCRNSDIPRKRAQILPIFVDIPEVVYRELPHRRGQTRPRIETAEASRRDPNRPRPRSPEKMAFARLPVLRQDNRK